MMRFEQVGREFSGSCDNGVVVKVSRVRDLASGDYRGQVEIQDGDVLLHSSVANLCVASARQTLVKSLRNGRHNWAAIVEEAFAEITRMLREGTPAVQIRSTDQVAPQQSLLGDFLPLNQTAMVFGKPGSNKSYLALQFAILVALPDLASAFGWKAGPKPVRTLYLDTETTQDTITRRIQELARGMGLVPEVSIYYKPLVGALASELESIQRTILEKDIGFVVLDSAGKGCGGDITQAGPVNDFFSSLGQLRKTTLVVTHEPKDAPKRNKSPYGSAYFEANARSVWHVQRGEGSENCFDLILRHTKSNDSALHRPIGLKVQFGQTPQGKSVRFSLQDLRDTEFASALPLRERIVELLGHGPLTVPEIAEALSESQATVRTRVNEGARDGILRKLPANKWGLSTSEKPSIQGTII